MAEIVDFGLQQHKIKMDGRFFENALTVVAGDTARRLEVQLLDTNNMVQDTTGLKLRLNAVVSGKATYTDAVLLDATKGLYYVDLANGMLMVPGNWQFQWQITDANDKKLHSFAFMGSIGSNISEGGSEATNFYLNADELKQMQDDLINGTFDSEVLETNIAEKLTDLETQYAPKLTEVTAQLAEKADAQDMREKLLLKSDKIEFTNLKESVDDQYNQMNNSIATIGSGKVDKNGANQISMQMLDQGVKTSMTGGTVAVVGQNSVGTDNIINGAVTFPKLSNLAQSLIFSSSGRILIDYATGEINIPAGTIVGGKKSTSVAAHTIFETTDVNSNSYLYFDFATNMMVLRKLNQLSSTPETYGLMGVIQFLTRDAFINASYSATGQTGNAIPTSFLPTTINISNRKFEATIAGSNSLLKVPAGEIRVGNTVFEFIAHEVSFAIGTKSAVYIAFNVSTKLFLVFNNNDLSRLPAQAVVVGSINILTYVTNFPAKIIVNNRAVKGTELAGTTAFMTNIERPFEVDFSRNIITIPARTAISYLGGYAGTPDTTGGVDVSISFVTGNEFMLAYDVLNKGFKLYQTSDMDKILESNVFIAHISKTAKKVTTFSEVRVIGGKLPNTNREIHQNAEMIINTTDGSQRFEVDTTPETVTELCFEAKSNSLESPMKINFYHQTTPLYDVEIDSTEYKPYRVKSIAPTAGLSKMVMNGNGSIRNVDILNRKQQQEPGRVLYAFHRGGASFTPENTMPGFRSVINMGARSIETDVRRTSDGVWVLLHDATINRTSNGTGNVADYTYQELLQFDFGSWKSTRFAGTKIPTLKEFLELCYQSNIKPFVELKAGTVNQTNVESLIAVFKETHMWEECYINSADFATLQTVANVDNTGTFGHIALPTKSSINNLKALGPKTYCSVWGWNVNNFEAARPYIELCKANNQPFVASSSNLNVLKKCIVAGSFASARDDVDLSNCYW